MSWLLESTVEFHWVSVSENSKIMQAFGFSSRTRVFGNLKTNHVAGMLAHIHESLCKVCSVINAKQVLEMYMWIYYVCMYMRNEENNGTNTSRNVYPDSILQQMNNNSTTQSMLDILRPSFKTQCESKAPKFHPQYLSSLICSPAVPPQQRCPLHVSSCSQLQQSS